MASHLAELIVAVETDPSRLGECRDLILDLWRVRKTLPGGDPLDRYANTLRALETAIGAEPSVFDLVLPSFARTPEPKDWASLARRIRRHTKFLSLAAVDLAIENDGLRRDELLDIADTAHPDAETGLLTIIRLVGLDEKGNRILDEDENKVGEALDDLQRTLDDFRTAYENGRAGAILNSSPNGTTLVQKSDGAQRPNE
ncbi:hypothetical protein SLT36_12030 [Aminobacter sp. BA135]|uniref:hypothetical protein n=1 Tax=Aminobacter sp. BA135 TaxID=537596 RepID=UPI003D79C6E3